MTRWCLLVLLILTARPLMAGDGLDVESWLSRPGVKMLAVEFYASWCGPCKKAVPQWKALHDKYRNQGLRLIVVSVRDPKGACASPGWNPDDVVCDADGRLSESWGVGDELPAAFLWSWRGPLLVRKGHVNDVKRLVEEELGRLPRVTLDEGMDRGVRDLLRTELARTGKVDVVAGADEEEAIAAIRSTSHEIQFSDRSACRLGERLAANSLLKASFMQAGTGKRLMVQLFSAETGCLSASAGVFWNEQRPEISAAEAVTELVNNLRVTAEMPGKARTAQVKEREIRDQEEDWQLEGVSGVVLAFETDPVGAAVLLDGKLLCQATPCSRLLAPGPHKVEFQLESYVPVQEVVAVNDKTNSIKRTMTPDFGWLTVRSKPPGLNLVLDGKPLGTTPLERRQVASGPHRLVVSGTGFYDKGKDVVVDRSEHEEVDLELVARQGGLQVFAKNQRGDDLKAQVFVDEQEVGNTPYAGKVRVGEHKVRVTLAGKEWKASVEIREKKVAKMDAVLDLGRENAEEIKGNVAIVGDAAGNKPSKALGWALAGAGVGIGFTGGILQAVANSTNDDLHEKYSSKDNYPDGVAAKNLYDADYEDEVRPKRTTAFVLYGVGGAATIAGVVLLLLDKNENAGRLNSAMTVTPVVFEGGAGAMMSFGF